MALADFFPKTDPNLNIGDANGKLLVGHSFDRPYNFTAFNGTTCKDEPVTFVGFNLIADIVDSAGVVLDSFTVTPFAGDLTGEFELHLDPAQVTTTLRDNAVQWKFRMVDGGTTNDLLILANFTVT
jgi:hypothetical protein